MNPTLVLFIMILVTIPNVIWYYIKYVVHQHGYKTGISPGWPDFQNLQKIIDKEPNPTKKRRLKDLMFHFYATLFIAIASFIIMIILDTIF